MTSGRPIIHYIRRPTIILLAFLLSSPFTLCKGQKQSDLAHPFQMKWEYEINSGVNITPATDGETIYVPLNNGNIISIRFNNGEFLWERENGGRISAAPTADHKGVYIASEIIHTQPQRTLKRVSGILRALSQSNGVTLWACTLPSPLSGTLVSNEATIFGGSSDGTLYAISKETGDVLWAKHNSASFNTASLKLIGDYLYISDEQGFLSIIEKRTGTVFRRYQTRKTLLGSLDAFDRTIFAGSSDGFIYAIDLDTGRFKWRVHTNAAVQSVQIAGDCLLATSLDNFIYCLSPKRGVKLWKRRLAGRIATQPLVFKESVFLSPISGEEFVVLRLRDGKVINSIFVGEGNITEAAPIISGSMLLLTTRKSVVAFSNESMDETTHK